MASFAQRMGLRPIRTVLQTDDLDEETRVELWNITHSLVRALAESQSERLHEVFNTVTSSIWAWEFKKARDEEPDNSVVWGLAKQQILKGKWVDALDLIEALVKYSKRFEHWSTQDILEAFLGGYNSTFERYLVGYRFIELQLIPIDSDLDVAAINSALDDSKPFRGARHHLSQAASLLADRQNPDYANSIKESISAVEATCVAVTRESTLGAALKKLKDNGVNIHPALESGWTRMYGWSSDADGIRHGSIEAPDANQSLAKYMLVACSAFVSHLIEVGRKARLL